LSGSFEAWVACCLFMRVLLGFSSLPPIFVGDKPITRLDFARPFLILN
jgi:hypothetical protein